MAAVRKQCIQFIYPGCFFIILTRIFTVVSFVIRTKDKWDTYALAKAIVIIKPIAHLNVN